MTEAGRITAIIDGDISALTSKMAQAKSVASSAAGDIEKDFKSKLGSGVSGAGEGLSKSFSSGKFSDAGKKAGEALVDGVSSSFGPLGGAVGEVATALGPTGKVAVAAVAGAAIIAASASSAAMEWEAGMSQISKTTGIEKSSAQFNTLSKDLQNLYSQMPTTVSEIQSVATSAGSLGIAQTEIAGFTQTALQMGSAFDIPAEQAAVGVGKIKSQTKSFTDEVKNLDGSVSDSKFAQHFGSAVDYAGNSLNATEADVLDFSTRTAGAFSNLGGNIYELAGWGGELSSVFSSSELASGSFNAALNQLMGTTKGSENARAKAGELLGVTPEDFQELMVNDPTDTLLDVGKAMEGLSAAERFQAAGILGGGYGDDFFQKMVGNTEEWREKIAEVKEEGEAGTSIGGSYEAGVENMKAQLEILGNSAGAIFQDIGGPLNEALTPVISLAAANLNSLRTIGENLWGPLTTALGPAITGVSTLASAVAGVGSMQLDLLVAASGAVSTGFEVGSAFVSAFGEELSDLVTGTETFQELSAAVESFGDTLSGIGDGIGDIASKIATGLADAIPTALSGAGDAVGTLLDKAGLGGVAEASGDVQDFLGGVYDNAAEKLGWGVEKGTKEGMAAGADAAKGAITDSTKSAVEDAYEAVQKAAKEFTEKNYSQYAAGMTQINGKWVSNQERDSFYKDKSLDSGKYSTFANGDIAWNLLKESASGKAHTLIAKIAVDGTEYTREFSTLEDTAESAEKKIKDEFRDIALDIPKYFRTAGSEISDALEGMLSDGVISFAEKDELGEYIASLEQTKIDFPIEFEQSGLDKQLEKLKATKLGLNVDLILGTDKLESDFYKWANENTSVWETYVANKQNAMEVTEARPEYQWLELNPDAVSLMQEYNTKLSSHEPSQLSDIRATQDDLVKLHPELQDMTWWTTKVNVAQSELNSHFKLVGNTLVGIDKDGKVVSEGYQAQVPVLNSLGTGLISAANAAAAFAKSVWSSVASISNVRYGSLPTSSTYAVPGTVERAYNAYRTNAPIYSPLNSLNLTGFAKGGFADQPTVMFGEAGEEAYVPITDRAAGLSILPEVLRKLGVRMAAKGLVMSDSLSSWGGQPHASSTVSSTEYDYYGSSLADKCASGCEIGVEKATSDWLESPDAFGDFNDGLQQVSISSAAVASANYKLAGSATYVSSRWMGDYDRFTITPPGTGFQSSDNRGYVPVAISEAAKENIIYNPFNDNESNWSAAGMDAKIFAMQQQYAGKSSVMPSSPHEEPSWIVDAAKSIAGKEVISRYSAGTLNQMAVEYDTLKAANTATARYADVTDKNFYQLLLQNSAIIQMTAESDEYCEAISDVGKALELEQSASETATRFRKSLIGVPSSYYPAMNAYLNEGKSFSEVESMLPGGASSNDRIVDAIDQTTEKVSDVEDAVDESTNEYSKFGHKLDALNDGIFATLGSIGIAGSSDLLAGGQTNATKYATWRLSEFDTYISSAESGLSSCFDYMSDWAKYQESVLAMPVSQGGMGFFKEESLGGFEKQFPSWGPWATAAQAAGIEGPWQSNVDEGSVATMTANGVTKGMDEAQLNQYLSNAVDYAKSTEKNTGEVVGEVRDMNGNLLAVQYSNGQIMSNLIAGGSGSVGWGGASIGGGGSWIGTSGIYNGMNGSVYYGSTVSGWGAQASNSISGNAGVVSIGQGALYYDKGGLVESPEYFMNDGQLSVRGEAGPELILPLSDPARTAELIHQYLPGVRKFAKGGLVGGAGGSFGSISESIATTKNYTFSPVISGVGLSKKEIQDMMKEEREKFFKELDRRDGLARGRRG